ncbi:MAG: hypothetical protein COB46_03630 [Rhodospirillaceae bacterium]|nr:MAG: hypothetical protein COB46_03630 [Rhodospirillaceae bacterium]
MISIPSRQYFPTRLLRATATLCLMIALGACSWNEDRTGKIGGAVGGILGGIAGSNVSNGSGRTAAIILGATLGTMWGEDIAHGMSNADKIFAERTTKDTLEYGKPGENTTWSNPETGSSGNVVANETYTNKDGENCRNFETTAHIEGEDRTTTGTACKMPDGEWKVMEDPKA